MVVMRMYAAGRFPDALIPPALLPSFQAYAAEVLRQSSAEERHLALWDGHRFLRPQDRRFVTADAIRWSALVGTREELIERIKAVEEAGVTQIAVSPPPDGVRDSITEVEHNLISRF
jgi:alkanesulfonate monooxygenase SsuD/methylene tetrahydromethanopterin reductase-like flavin-dependent oxidoreductase (luciferase family)